MTCMNQTPANGYQLMPAVITDRADNKDQAACYKWPAALLLFGCCQAGCDRLSSEGDAPA
jgi:hypothetical protein